MATFLTTIYVKNPTRFLILSACHFPHHVRLSIPFVAVVDDGDGVGVGGGFNDGREERLSRRALGSFLLNNLSLRLRVRV